MKNGKQYYYVYMVYQTYEDKSQIYLHIINRKSRQTVLITRDLYLSLSLLTTLEKRIYRIFIDCNEGRDYIKEKLGFDSIVQDDVWDYLAAYKRI